MQARIVATPQGARWLIDGWRMFRAAPLGWLALVFAYLLLTNLVMLVPVVGVVAFLILYPPFSVGLMAAARAASRRAPHELGMLFDGFRHGLRAQLILGAVYLASSIVVFGGTLVADQQDVLRGILSGRRKADELGVGDVFGPLAVLAALYTPVLMMFWFAPPLAAWHTMGAMKALFFSFVACLMNWRALLVYGLVTLLATLAVTAGALFAFALASGGTTKVTPAALVLPLALLLLPTLFASFYASYRDVFGVE
jgi:hypothetical protein